MSRYTITTCDVCAPGFERLRNRDEFILCAAPRRGDTAETVREELHADIQRGGWCDDNCDYDAVREAVDSYITASVAWLQSECDNAPTPEETDGDSDALTLFLYVKDSEYVE